MKIYYNNNLKKFSQQNRHSGNLSEALLWLKLKNKKLHGYQFNRQKPILNYIVDFYCKQLKLVIEIDGNSHIDIEKDCLRQKEIEDLGLKVIRFKDIDIKKNMAGVIMVLESWIDEFEKKQRGE
ncbi:MAG TPA: endonuclease domain-containing protein [Candidatus Kapabacteria bacterium]|nr:endonuclease domain-containing protein [Candidatus Kapabacteria bacterium]